MHLSFYYLYSADLAPSPLDQFLHEMKANCPGHAHDIALFLTSLKYKHQVLKIAGGHTSQKINEAYAHAQHVSC